MKLKSSAIAVAVAGALGASMAAQADFGGYADLRIGFESKDTMGNSEIQIQNQSSRFGFRGETDMGNGLTGFGRVEFGLRTEGASNDNPIFRRHAYVGLKGDWGSVKLGQTYHTFYSMITGPLDNPLIGTAPGTAGTFNDTWIGYTGRTDQGITYSGDWGIFSLGATAYMDSSSTDASGKANDLDKYELAGAFQAGPVNLAIGVSDQDEVGGLDPEPIIGLLASGWQTGIFTWGLGYTMQDAPDGFTNDAESIVFDVAIASGYVHWEQTDNSDAGAPDPTNLTLGYAQSLGRQTTMYYEYQNWDKDEASVDSDVESLRALLRYKWK